MVGEGGGDVGVALAKSPALPLRHSDGDLRDDGEYGANRCATAAAVCGRGAI